MDILLIFQAIVMGVVQGITEWLPISSTGHLILFNEFMNMNVSDKFMETFEVVIQFGSILAVLVLYFEKLNPFTKKNPGENYRFIGNINLKKDTINLYFKVLVAVLPAAVIGLLFDDKLNEIFYNAQTVSATLIIYGILFIVIESMNHTAKYDNLDTLSYKTAFFIGVFQILALIPGTSRSGSTILGATLIGCSRGVAAEFSFFLAIPVMFGASALKLLKSGLAFTPSEWTTLVVGMIVAFAVSVAAIKFLVGYIRKHDFKGFGYYRIVLGILLIIYFFVLN